MPSSAGKKKNKAPTTISTPTCAKCCRGSVFCRCSSPPRTCRTTWSFFFFNDTATTEIYTLSLHDALPIRPVSARAPSPEQTKATRELRRRQARSEEHTSELQSHVNLVCRLLLEKKKKKNNKHIIYYTKKKRIEDRE